MCCPSSANKFPLLGNVYGSDVAILMSVSSDWMLAPMAQWEWVLALHWRQHCGAGTMLQANELSVWKETAPLGSLAWKLRPLLGRLKARLLVLP